jgi:hypothetical protein
MWYGNFLPINGSKSGIALLNPNQVKGLDIIATLLTSLENDSSF